MTESNTYLAVVMDRSGSMAQVAAEAANGLNDFLRKQKAVPGKCRFTMVQFDSQSTDCLHRNIKLKNLEPAFVLQARAGTPLFDAIGTTITMVEDDIAEKPRQVIFVIITDGEENSSREYTLEKIQALITKHTDEGWSFVYLGAGVDAFAREQHFRQSGAMNVNHASTLASASSAAGYGSTYAVMDSAVTRSRTSAKPVEFTEEERSAVEDASTSQ